MYFKAKKSLGQNFLKSEKALKAMVLAAEVESSDIVLEIGPGQGALTEHLLKTGATVVAVEKDDNLFIFLQEKFAFEINNKKLFLVHDDILEFDEEKQRINNLVKGKYKIAANIPYYITGQIIRQFLTSDNQPSEMAILVQKEVAERIVANDSKESLLSIGVKAYGHPKKEMVVSRGSFTPAPNVDSAIISIKNISRDYFSENKIDEEKFWEIIHYAFAHKRKTLANNLRGVIDQKTWQKFLQKENLPPSVRAEDLTLKNWVTLFI